MMGRFDHVVNNKINQILIAHIATFSISENTAGREWKF